MQVIFEKAQVAFFQPSLNRLALRNLWNLLRQARIASADYPANIMAQFMDNEVGSRTLHIAAQTQRRVATICRIF